MDATSTAKIDVANANDWQMDITEFNDNGCMVNSD